MSTVAEIEMAIKNLQADEREALESRLLARRFGVDTLSENEQSELCGLLDEAEREIESGRGLSADDLHQSVRAWAYRELSWLPTTNEKK